MINEINKITQTRYGKMLYNKNDTLVGKSSAIPAGSFSRVSKNFLS